MIAKWELECVCHAGVLCGTNDYTRCFRCGWNDEVSEARKKRIRERIGGQNGAVNVSGQLKTMNDEVADE